MPYSRDSRKKARASRDARSPGEHRETWLFEWPRERWGPDAVKVALCYPAGYALGMSNLGFQTALRCFLETPGVVCERAFWEPGSAGEAAPVDALTPGALTTDAAISHAVTPEILTVESGRRLGEFDVVAFSVSFEEDYLALAAMLGAAGVPLVSLERGGSDPLVIMGGVCAYLNPEPVADFLDAVLVGEAEALVGPFATSLRATRGAPRVDRLQALAAVDGIYIPALYRVERDESGRVSRFDTPAGVRLPVRPAVAGGRAADGTASGDRMPATAVLSDGAFFSDMMLLEVSRGCARGCRFCAAGSVLAPRRARSAGVILSEVEAAAEHTRRVGLVTAALMDHPEAQAILEGLERLGAEVNVSSLRADAVTPEIARLLADCGVTTVTVAPETGSADLRRAIGKPVSDEALLAAAGVLADAGVRGLKLYFMVGLPGETAEDLEAVVALSRRVRERFVGGRSGATMSVSVSPFVPKPRTPFQWLPMAGEDEIRRSVAFLRKSFARRPRIDFTAAGPREAEREGVLSRGGRELAEAIRLTAIDGVPWKAALRRAGVDAEAELTRVRDEDEVFPWEVIEAGPPRSELLASLRIARSLIESRA